jgi:ketosteroid isomerase-like protein
MTRSDDEVEIRSLIGKLARGADLGTVDEYVALVTDDAVMTVGGNVMRSGIASWREGTAAVREAGTVGPGSNTMHFIGSTAVDVEGDTATSYSTFVMFKDTTTGPMPASAGRYNDTFVRTADGWRLSRRDAQIG